MSNFARTQQRNRLKKEFKELRKANPQLKHLKFSDFVEYVNNVRNLMAKGNDARVAEDLSQDEDLSDVLDDMLE